MIVNLNLDCSLSFCSWKLYIPYFRPVRHSISQSIISIKDVYLSVATFKVQKNILCFLIMREMPCAQFTIVYRLSLSHFYVLYAFLCVKIFDLMAIIDGMLLAFRLLFTIIVLNKCSIAKRNPIITLVHVKCKCKYRPFWRCKFTQNQFIYVAVYATSRD